MVEYWISENITEFIMFNIRKSIIIIFDMIICNEFPFVMN